MAPASRRYPREVPEPDRIDELAALFTFLADTDFAGYSPLYERIARVMAGSPDLLAVVDEAAASNSRRGRVPVLFHATLHDLALRRPNTRLGEVFAGADCSDTELSTLLATTLRTEATAITTTMRTRSVQTNEVGRSAAIAAGLAAIDTGGREIALVELGPSAGLNLFVDRWHIDHVRDGEVTSSSGPSDSTVSMRCELVGPLTPPHRPLPTIALRTGVDPNPIDASDPDESRWLRACVWPDVPDRPQRLAAAIDLVAQDPPELVRGDAVTDLAPLVAGIDAALLPVVVSTWAMAYVSADGRAAIGAALDAIGARRDLDLLTLEEPRFTPGIDDPAIYVDMYRGAGDGTPTLLAHHEWRDGERITTVLALCHPHVRWMRWLDGGDDG